MRRKDNRHTFKDGYETFMCTILTQFLISELDENRVKKKGKHVRCAAD